MAIPDYFIQELKSRISIEDVVSSYVSLKRRGKNLLGLCPFHGEKTPSFNVNTENSYFHCFGCGAGGDAITFIMRIENLDYVEAIKFLANREGLTVPESGVDNSLSKLRTRVLEINRETARFYHSVLMSEQGKVGLDYFKRRGLGLKLLKTFGLGFAPSDRFSLVNHLKKLGYTKDEMASANVAFLSKNGNPVDRFVSRVMFPIIDLRGNVVAFGGRALGDEKPKYINSSDTPVYKKSAGLFAMNFAKNDPDNLILAEGYMDVIALHGAGFKGAIASLGTALTLEQAKIIARYANEVTICYDSDEAGQKATERAIPILRDCGLNIKVLKVPGGKDPDEFIRNNGEKGPILFKKLLEASGNDVEYRLMKLKTEINPTTSQDKVKYLTKACEVLAGVENSIEKNVYAGKLAEELNVDKSAILEQANKYEKTKKRQKATERNKQMQKEISGVGDRVNPEKSKNRKVSSAEEGIIAYIFIHPDGLEYCKRNINTDDFCTAFAKKVYSILCAKDMPNGGITITDVVADFTSAEIESITKTIVRYSSALITKEDANRYIDIIKNEGRFYATDDIIKADDDELADYFKKLRDRKLN